MMNKTKIDWCDYTWNPVTGCLHGCDYCYARRIANRFKDKRNLTYVDGVKPEHLSSVPYPYGFLPTFHPNRLNDPAKVKKPQNIFVCSMADLFGKWVPDEWIKAVFEACLGAEQHNYLFLTKNTPKAKKLSDNYGFNITLERWWFGTTVTSERDKHRIKFLPPGFNTFVSFEPLLGPIDIRDYLENGYVNWIIVGAQTGPGAVKPKSEWVQGIIDQGRAAKTPIFLKDNLNWVETIQEFPWQRRSNDE